jgi:hypothetical protein
VRSMTIYLDDSGTSPENAVAVAAGWIAPTQSRTDFQAPFSVSCNARHLLDLLDLGLRSIHSHRPLHKSANSR